MIYNKNTSHFPLVDSNPIGYWTVQRLAYIKNYRKYFQKTGLKRNYEMTLRNDWQGNLTKISRWTGKES